MDDTGYQYLNEERVKLWQELRRTQAQLDSLVETLAGDQDAIEKGLRSVGVKAARAFTRLKERADSSEELTAKLDAAFTHATEIANQATAVSERLQATKTTIQEAEQKISEDLSQFDADMESVAKKTEELEGQLETITEHVKTAKSLHDKLQEEVDDFSSKYEDSNIQHSEISKFHSLLFGYTKNDGEIVEGKKQELEKAYDELGQKIVATKTDAESFESDYKKRVAEFLSSAKTEADALAEKVRGLLPDAMTAGLSAAYLANRKMEEQEQDKQLATFKKCIVGMMAFALLPIAINLILWWGFNKSFTDILAMLPREMMYILPVYIPLFWLAIFANKRVNLSKRLIEEYKHKEAVSKTYEGLAKQIDELGDDKASQELRTRLLYNTVMLSEKNPGELIKNFNRPDNPLLDALNQGARFSESIAKLKEFPGFDGLVGIASSLSQKPSADPKKEEEEEE